MQLWFWSAVLGGVLAGISNFCFKIAAKREYDAESFSLYGGITSIVLVGIFFPFLAPQELEGGLLMIITLAAGAIATFGGIMKVYALRHIDTTIFSPLFKLFGPLIAVVWGVVFFDERFSVFEWLGILLGLFVPLLLITKVENIRQSNLLAGLVLVMLTACTSACAAILNKYVIDKGMSELETLWYAAWGVFVGTIFVLLMKHGVGPTTKHIKEHLSWGLFLYSSLRAGLITLSLFFILYAYGNGGTLGVVQTIHSMYILIPIVLAIYFYKEHWNAQKALAVVLSVVALAFFH